MLRRTLWSATRWLTLIATVSTLAIVSGCNFSFESDAPDDVDRKILGSGGAAMISRIDGQSAMLGTSCVRSMGPRLAQMRAENATIEQMRSELHRSCTTTEQQVQGTSYARPSRGRLFAPMQSGRGVRHHGSSGSTSSWYTWFWNPFSYWSPVVTDNVKFCRRLFNNYWNDGTCFALFYDFVTYQYYDPFCYRHCNLWGYNQTASGSGTGTSTATSPAIWNPCVSRRCAGQLYW